MRLDFIDYYQLLEVHIFSSKEALKAAYKRLSIMHHPDNGGNKAFFSLIGEAYRTLNDDQERKKYLEEWKRVKLPRNEMSDNRNRSDYENLAFQPLRETVHEYMFFIMNKEYEKAYDMLCKETTKSLFKKDFCRWQELVGEVHEILSFSSSFDELRYSQENGVQVVFQVKVREYNLLLSRQEEDFFGRALIFEEHAWKIILPKINIHQVIKKYKRIIHVNKKRSRKIAKRNSQKYYTKYLDMDSFKQNVDYEYLRYQRYQRCFALMFIHVATEGFSESNKITKLTEMNSRITDSYCMTDDGNILLLLPETDQKGVKVFREKIAGCFKENKLQIRHIKAVNMDSSIKSAKELINKVFLNE